MKTMNRCETTNDRIRAAGWFHGTERQWQELSQEQREDIAFNAIGCAVAYPTWTGPVDCVHVGCMIRRGQLPAIAETNRTLRSEREYGYLRFLPDSSDGRKSLAAIYRAVRKVAIETGVYDPWKMPDGWKLIVGAGIGAIIAGHGR